MANFITLAKARSIALRLAQHLSENYALGAFGLVGEVSRALIGQTRALDRLAHQTPSTVGLDDLWECFDLERFVRQHIDDLDALERQSTTTPLHQRLQEAFKAACRKGIYEPGHGFVKLCAQVPGLGCFMIDDRTMYKFAEKSLARPASTQDIASLDAAWVRDEVTLLTQTPDWHPERQSVTALAAKNMA
jgi:hypothetical protein